MARNETFTIRGRYSALKAIHASLSRDITAGGVLLEGHYVGGLAFPPVPAGDLLKAAGKFNGKRKLVDDVTISNRNQSLLTYYTRLFSEEMLGGGNVLGSERSSTARSDRPVC